MAATHYFFPPLDEIIVDKVIIEYQAFVSFKCQKIFRLEGDGDSDGNGMLDFSSSVEFVNVIIIHIVHASYTSAYQEQTKVVTLVTLRTVATWITLVTLVTQTRVLV